MVENLHGPRNCQKPLLTTLPSEITRITYTCQMEHLGNLLNKKGFIFNRLFFFVVFIANNYCFRVKCIFRKFSVTLEQEISGALTLTMLLWRLSDPDCSSFTGSCPMAHLKPVDLGHVFFSYWQRYENEFFFPLLYTRTSFPKTRNQIANEPFLMNVHNRLAY